jgi:hypothetical protein
MKRICPYFHGIYVVEFDDDESTEPTLDVF